MYTRSRALLNPSLIMNQNGNQIQITNSNNNTTSTLSHASTQSLADSRNVLPLAGPQLPVMTTVTSTVSTTTVTETRGTDTAVPSSSNSALVPPEIQVVLNRVDASIQQVRNMNQRRQEVNNNNAASIQHLTQMFNEMMGAQREILGGLNNTVPSAQLSSSPVDWRAPALQLISMTADPIGRGLAGKGSAGAHTSNNIRNAESLGVQPSNSQPGCAQGCCIQSGSNPRYQNTVPPTQQVPELINHVDPIIKNQGGQNACNDGNYRPGGPFLAERCYSHTPRGMTYTSAF